MQVSLSPAQIGVICNILENSDSEYCSQQDLRTINDYLKDCVYSHFNEMPFTASPLYLAWLDEFDLVDF